MKCNLCDFSADTDEKIIEHLMSEHAGVLVKEKMTAKQFWYHHINRHKLKNIGICSCGKPKKWNEENGKYEHYCYSPEHTTKLRQSYENNMIQTYNTNNPASLIDHQIKMMAGRDIAKTFEWNKNKFIVLSDIEYGILDILKKRGRKPSRIEAPAVSIKIQYKLPNESNTRNHIPDVFDEEYNAVYSGKDGMDNPNRHPAMKKDRIKNLYEYQAILNNTNYNYIQVEGKSGLKEFDKELRKLEQMYRSGSRYVMPPRIDVHMLLESENDLSEFMLDTIVITEDSRLGLTSSSMNFKKVFFHEFDTLLMSKKDNSDININYNMMINNYSDILTEVSIADEHDIIINVIETVKQHKELLEEFIMDVIR